jgi:hypothetical protein
VPLGAPGPAQRADVGTWHLPEPKPLDGLTKDAVEAVEIG